MEQSTIFDALRRAVVEMLIADGEDAIAAVALDCSFELEDNDWKYPDLCVGIPAAYAKQFGRDANDYESSDQSLLREAAARAAEHQFFTSDGEPYNPEIKFKIRLVLPDTAWEERTKALIAQAKASNQGLVTGRAFARRGKEPILYGELKFGSQSEVRIVQELEAKKVLFFPLAVGVRAETGKNHEDHREADFLIIHEGVVGILEVAGPNHGGRYVSDFDKEAWFGKSGIICIKQYPSELCFDKPAEIVDGFLELLSKHKK